ncbi:hypothetical protein CD30_08755 [Ureibacillus massiliensis 4400831 = CIP 108448 = CCUG 49529]|uniref:Phosphonate ABC transporter substrate-binding protein n=1 Tax=Ureibacillus massiliensis 4400831 = CIP 108448 = CCUG 49529 TaxID=1211035 RepID=A0A0A3J720_9BACL|nr:phosphate/phosphite/phosphonate ABC transporter substrate-binding protein [Ureibacillus massiliensis]KGR90973.1 hypothetical protein CD30_08755 [Ureibacillus massiliensis 4400831 = CIP 108448 = CCUG 49529]
MRKSSFLVVILVILNSFLVGCSTESEKLTIGMIPVRDAEEMKSEFEPIELYLEKHLDKEIEVYITDNYAGLVEGMKDGVIDIGWFGAFSFIAAESQIDLTPLVVQERRETGLYYQSYIITRNDSSIETLEDLEDKSFAFVDPGSTSGFVLPYALLKSRNIDIESYFSNIIYSGTHDQVPEDILSGKVEAGAISSIQFDKLEADGKLIKDDFKIIWHSDHIPGSPYVARTDLDRGVKEGFIESMLNIHEEIPNELHKFDASIERYVEVDNNIYHSIRNIATILGKDYMYEYFLKGE